MNWMKRVAALLIAVVVLCTSGIGEMPMVQAEENIETGACGDNLTYTLDKTTGELVISGTGDMWDWDWCDSPWYNDEDIKSVIVSEGVMSVGANAFRECDSLTMITLESSVQKICEDAFEGMNDLQKVIIYNPAINLEDISFYYSYEVLLISYEGSTTQQFANKKGMSFLPFESEGTCGDNLQWKLDNVTGELAISGTGDMWDWNWHDNTSPWYDYEHVESVVVSEGVTSVGDCAFYECYGLDSVTLEKTVDRIGDRAFWYVGSPEIYIYIYIDTILSIETDAFYGSKVVFVSNEDSTTELYAYEQGMPFVSFEELDEIRGWCGGNAYYTLDATGTLTVTGSGSIYDVTDSEKAPWDAYKNQIKKVVLTNDITYVGNMSFADCANLKEVEIYNQEINFGQDVFKNSSSVKLYAFRDSNVKEYTVSNGITFEEFEMDGQCGPHAFYELKSDEELVISGTGGIGSGFLEFNKSRLVENIIIEEGIQHIGRYVFWSGEDYDEDDELRWQSLETVNLPEGLKTIGEGAFQQCRLLKNFNIPQNLEVIGRYAFYDCSGLTSLNLSDNIVSIGEGAFQSWNKLKSVSIPEGVLRIEDCTFLGCSQLEKVMFPDDLKSIGESGFKHCDSLKEVILPLNLTTIENAAFYGCESLEEINIPNGVKFIGENAFGYCGKLEEITIPGSVEKIGKNAFSYDDYYYDSRSTRNVTLKNGITNIWESAFANANIESINIPDTVTLIEREAFREGFDNKYEYEYYFGEKIYTGNVSITLPQSVATVKSYAFADNPGLKNVKVYNPEMEFGLKVFDNCEKLVLHGYDGSTTEAYAEEYGIPFVSLNVTAMEISTLPTKLHYCVGDELDLTGMKVKVSYADGSVEYVDGAVCQIEGFNSNSAGEQTITVRYGEITDTFTVTVNMPGVTLPITYATLNVGEFLTLDAVTTPAGSEITWKTSNADVAPVWQTSLSGEAYARQAGNATITASITYQGETYSARCYVTVKGIELKPVSNLKASLTGYDDVKVSWSSVSGATGYKVYYKKSGSSKYSFLTHTTGTTYSKSNLSVGTKYSFKIIPYYAGEEEIVYAKSKTVSIYTLKKMSTPTVSKYSTSKATVKWTAIGGATGYQISKSTKKSGTSIVSTTTGTSKTISATKGKTYYYKVRAYKLEGSKKIYGPWSSVRSFKVR